MYIQGKIIQIYDTQSGESPRGTWKKKEFVVETYAKIPKKICLSVRGEGVELFKHSIGESLQISIDIESREHNGRWFTEVRAWKFEPITQRDHTGGDTYDETDVL